MSITACTEKKGREKEKKKYKEIRIRIRVINKVYVRVI